METNRDRYIDHREDCEACPREATKPAELCHEGRMLYALAVRRPNDC